MISREYRDALHLGSVIWDFSFVAVSPPTGGSSKAGRLCQRARRASYGERSYRAANLPDFSRFVTNRRSKVANRRESPANRRAPVGNNTDPLAGNAVIVSPRRGFLANRDQLLPQPHALLANR